MQLPRTFELPFSLPLAVDPAIATSAASTESDASADDSMLQLEASRLAASPYHTANSRHRRSIRMRDPRLGSPIATAAACVIVRTSRHYRIACIADSSPRRAAIVRLQLDIAGHHISNSREAVRAFRAASHVAIDESRHRLSSATAVSAFGLIVSELAVSPTASETSILGSVVR